MLQWLTRKCERECVAQGRAGAASAAFDGLNLRLDLIAARSCAVHVVRTPGHPDVRKVQFPDFLCLAVRLGVRRPVE